MKLIKIILVSLIVTLMAAFTVEAADPAESKTITVTIPEVSGEVELMVGSEHRSYAKAELNFDGKLLNDNFEYLVSIEVDTETRTQDNPTTVMLNEAAFLYNLDKFVNVKIGKFKYNPSVMDMLDTVNTKEMNAINKVSLDAEHVYFAVGYQHTESTTRENDGTIVYFGDGSYQVELDWIMKHFRIGVNYQDAREGRAAVGVNFIDPGLIYQFEIMPCDSWKLYGEYGNPTGYDKDDQRFLGGILITYQKASLRYERDCETDYSIGKIGYDFTPNILLELQADSEDVVDVLLTYRFKK